VLVLLLLLLVLLLLVLVLVRWYWLAPRWATPMATPQRPMWLATVRLLFRASPPMPPTASEGTFLRRA